MSVVQRGKAVHGVSVEVVVWRNEGIDTVDSQERLDSSGSVGQHVQLLSGGKSGKVFVVPSIGGDF